MAMIAFCTLKGSAGATTTAVALTRVWPERVVLVEADPLGGAVVPGYFEGMLAAPADLLGLVNVARHGGTPDQLWPQTLPMDAVGHRLLVPGLTDPCVQGPVAAAAWTQTAGLLRAVADRDVLVDCGRLAHPYAPVPVLASADVVVVITGASLPDIYAVQRHLAVLRDAIARVGQQGNLTMRESGPHIRLVVVETAGRRGAAAMAAATGIDAVGLPFDPRSAAVFSQGRSPMGVRRHNAYLHRINRLAPALRALALHPDGRAA